MYTIHFENPIHIHFIGIGGISMSGLAEILLKEGFQVSGSDMTESALTKKLISMGAKIDYPQKADNIKEGIDLVVYTAAIHEDNPEYAAAVATGLPMMPRAELLGQIMHNYANSIGVSGTHGKTTTTSMLTHILIAAGADPTISVGGMLKSINGNIRVGSSDTFLAEACEYTNSFLHLFPRYTIILNIEEDHLDFFADLNDIRHSFRAFAAQTSEQGCVIINGEIEDYQEIVADSKAEVITFGLNPESLFHPGEISFDEKACCSFDVYKSEELLGHIHLGVPGTHNVANALSAIALVDDLKIPFETCAKALSDFHGTDRRFEYKGMFKGVTVVDDYAHHPSEIEATLKAAKKYPHERLIVAFQSHTYTRTKSLLPDFGRTLAAADEVVLAPIFAARETDTLGVSAESIKEEIEKYGTKATTFPDFDAIEKYLFENCHAGDLLITMGAGNLYTVGEKLVSH
jgi:UDP-N-acetylmuramate--alanine ligase